MLLHNLCNPSKTSKLLSDTINGYFKSAFFIAFMWWGAFSGLSRTSQGDTVECQI